MTEKRKIVVLAGDGIGPEIVAATREVLDRVAPFEYEEHLIGGISIDENGTALTDAVTDACRASDAVLLGAVGGPKWDEAVARDPKAQRPEQGLLGIRKALGLYANVVSAFTIPGTCRRPRLHIAFSLSTCAGHTACWRCDCLVRVYCRRLGVARQKAAGIAADAAVAVVVAVFVLSCGTCRPCMVGRARVECSDPVMYC